MTGGKSNTNSVSRPRSKRKLLWAVGGVGLVILVAAGAFMYRQLVGPGVDDKAAALSQLQTDQPSPIPSSGQIDTVEDYCQIVTPELAQRLGATDAPINTDSFIGSCDIPLAGGAIAQISSVGPYGQLTKSNNPWFVEAATIQGLEGRAYNLAAPLSGECTINVNTRSVNTLNINVRWYIPNDLERATKRKQSCDLAKHVAEVLTKAYVPLAGGTVHPKALQRPSPKAIEEFPCKVVDSAAAIRGQVYNIADDKNGVQKQRQQEKNQCTYTLGSNKAVVTLDTSGKRLTDTPAQNARQLGVLPARQLESGNTCAFAVEITPGIISEITYTGDKFDGTSCRLAELMQAVSVYSLINVSSTLTK